MQHLCQRIYARAQQRVCKVSDFSYSRKAPNSAAKSFIGLFFFFFSSCTEETELNPLSATDTLQCNNPVVDACKECIVFYQDHT